MKSTYANRGKSFEHLIESTNQQYLNRGRAVINKIPTPVKVVRRGKKITGAWFEKKSTVDYQGIYNGRAIAFEAKSTRELSRFPLSNIEEHQYEFLKRWQDNGGISFVLVEFTRKQEVYMLPFKSLETCWNIQKRGGRKSIPYEHFLLNCELVKSKNGILLDYLSALRL